MIKINSLMSCGPKSSPALPFTGGTKSAPALPKMGCCTGGTMTAKMKNTDVNNSTMTNAKKMTGKSKY